MDDWLSEIPEVTKHIKNTLCLWDQVKKVGKDISPILPSRKKTSSTNTKVNDLDGILSEIHNSYISLFRHGLSNLPVKIKNANGEYEWWYDSERVDIEDPKTKLSIYNLISDLNQLRERNWDLRVRVRSEANLLAGTTDNEATKLYLIAIVLYFVEPERLAEEDGFQYLINNRSLLDAQDSEYSTGTDNILRTPSRFLARLTPEVSVTYLRNLLEEKITILQKAYSVIAMLRSCKGF